MKRLLPPALLLLLALRAPAGLGETPQQCTDRYGTPVSRGENQLVFEAEGLQILVSFYHDKADYLAFSAAPRPGVNPRPLTEEEISRLLKRNAGSESWVLKSSTPGRKIWVAPTRYAETNALGELTIMAQEHPLGTGATKEARKAR